VNLSAGFRREPPVDPATIGEDAALAARIRGEIAASGPMTFARFMELALYDPDGGYYRAAAPRPGREGDFLTAPEAHPIFGHVVGRQLVEAWEALGRPDPFVVREHGAGTGTLADAVLRGLEADGSPLLAAIRYQAFEVDERRLTAFTERLGAAGFGTLLEPADARPVTGAVVANEVLDALPVHRIGMRDGRLLERYVDLAGDELVDAWAAPSTAALAERLADEKIALAEGQAAEVCLGLDGWVSGVVAGLQPGLLLVVDYGAPAVELYDPARRPHGTLRAYVRHRVHDDVYRHIGRQDLTAHVDLTALERSMRSAGLTMLGSTTQAEFLVGSGVEELLRAVQQDPATTMTAYVELRSALMRLLDPAAMGGFQVVAAGRVWPEGVALSGFGYRGPGRDRAD
jgi:SAM-dependent MidA family methyltransferase